MAIDGKEEELGFHLERRKSRRNGPVVVTDLDFADDIALLSMDIRQVKELLESVEKCVGKVGLKMNAGKINICLITNMKVSPSRLTMDQS